MPKAGDTRANAPAPSQPTTRERGNWGGVQDDGRDKGLPGGAAPVQADLGMMRGYTGLRDMVDRGGPGKAAPGGQFSGAGPISTAANFIAGGGILGLLGRGLAGLDGLRNPNYVPGTLPPEFQPGYRDNDGPSPQPQEEEEEAVTPMPTPTIPYVPPVRPPVEVPTMYEPYTGGLPTLAPTVDLGFPDMQGNFDPYYLAAMSGSPLGFQEGGSVSPIDRVLEIGRTALGMNENEQNAALRDYLATGGQNLDPATTAWCAAYVNATLNQAGLEGSGSLAARSFLDVGTPVDEPQPGDLAVFWRGSPDDWRGHVGFYQGMDPEGNILHPGNVHRQLDRAIENVDALLAQSGATRDDMRAAIVYVRNPGDCAALWPEMRERYGDVPIEIVVAPVCRPGWLVEIEGMAVIPTFEPDLPPF